MLGDKLRKVFETADRAAIEELYRSDALLDANVPAWRFQRKGIDEIVAQYGEWTAAAPMTVLGLREWQTPWGVVIENDVSEPGEDGFELYSRQVHLLFTDGEKVERHVMYCTGQWDVDTVERQRAEAPMYEP